ncbi:UNVERIFIED_CONTAM: hypothetical protein Sindi_0483700, partial [Sesamum indicum]
VVHPAGLSSERGVRRPPPPRLAAARGSSWTWARGAKRTLPPGGPAQLEAMPRAGRGRGLNAPYPSGGPAARGNALSWWWGAPLSESPARAGH